MPKLMIKSFGDAVGDIYELEQARYLLNFDASIVVVEGQTVRSYEELVQQIAQERFRNKEFIEVMQLPSIQGG